MARTPQPWFREDRQAWFVTIRGKRHNLGPDEKEAHRLFHEILGRKEDSPTSPPAPKDDGLTVAEVFDKFLTWCRQHREPSTYQGYHNFAQSFLDHLGDKALLPALDLRPFHVSEWVDAHKTWGATRRRNAMVHVQRPYNWAYKLGYLTGNPIRHLEKPRAKRRENHVTPADFTEIIGKVQDQPFHDLLTFAWETGCRPQEARHIEVRHFNSIQGRIEIPPAEAKGRKRWRIIRLTTTALEIVRRQVQARSDGKLFLNCRGKPWKTYAICCRFQRLKAKLGKRWAAYDFRHGFAQRMLESGIDHLTVAELMGHSNGQMVATVYSHMDKADDHLAEALKRASGDSPA